MFYIANSFIKSCFYLFKKVSALIYFFIEFFKEFIYRSVLGVIIFGRNGQDFCYQKP